MSADTSDLECIVERIYREAGAGPDDVWRPSRIARALFGPDVLYLVPDVPGHAQLTRMHGGPVIAVRKGLSPAYRDHAIAHELGHWALELEGVPHDEHTENACDFIGAALITRRRPFARVARHDYRQLALDFRTTETLVALRVGEVLNEPVAVVSPHLVRARGEGWRSLQTIRLYAHETPAGLVKVRLHDEPQRVALHA